LSDLLARSALWYAQKMGWRVFPCLAGRKEPAIRAWQHNATNDPRQVRTWWSIRSEQNIGVACGPDSGLWVLDVDAGEKDGEASLEVLQRRFGRLPATLEQRTGGGGRQLFFTYPDGHDCPNSVGSRGGLGAGLDTRSRGGFVVAPPSIHPSGIAYRWVEGRGPHQVAAAALPTGWIKRVEKRQEPRIEVPIRPTRTTAERGGELIGRCADRVARAGPGTRNDTLYKAAFRLACLARAGQLFWSDAETAMVSAGLAAGLDQKEIAATLRSARQGARAG
jgi:hypothetical protein